METRKIMRKYDATAEGYDELYQEEQEQKYLSSWREILKIEKSLVDVGCGTLLFERFLKTYGLIRRIQYIVGLDISEKMLETGFSKIKEDAEIIEKLDLVRGDASRLPFRDSAFEYGVSFTVFTLLISERIGISELRRVVKKGGIFSLLKKFNRIDLGGEYKLFSETDKDSIYVFNKQDRWREVV